MITLSQIKAARALLGWTQERLAQVAGLSLPAVNNLERGLTTPRRETLQHIETALSAAGIDFIDHSGVRLRPPELETRIIEGPDWLHQYDDILIGHMRHANDEICQFSCDERLWMVYGSTTNHHYIDHRNQVGFKERIIIRANADFVTNKRMVYRTLAPDYFGSISWQIFDAYVAQILWDRQQIILTRSSVMAEAQQRLFTLLWQEAEPFSDAAWARVQKWDYPG